MRALIVAGLILVVAAAVIASMSFRPQNSLDVYTMGLAAFTLVLAISTVALWFETRQSRLLGERQAKQTAAIVRASVAIDGGEIFGANVDGQPGYGVHVRLKNFGSSPAVDLRTWMAPPEILPMAALPFGQKTVQEDVQAKSFAGPGAAVDLSMHRYYGATGLSDVRAETHGFFAWGGAEYKDIFGEPHSFYFRIRTSGVGQQAELWGLTPHPLGYESK